MFLTSGGASRRPLVEPEVDPRRRDELAHDGGLHLHEVAREDRPPEEREVLGPHQQDLETSKIIKERIVDRLREWSEVDKLTIALRYN